MASSVLLNQPLPLSAVQLGRLVRDPLYPDEEFHQPAFPVLLDNQREGEGGQAAAAVEYKLDNLRDTLNRSRGTRLEATLLSTLRLRWHVSEAEVRATVAARRGVVRQLRSPQAYFEAACKDDNVRAWVEVQARRSQPWRRGNGGGVYLVCGLKMLTDACVEQAATQRTGFEATVSIPAMPVGALPAGLGLDVGAGVALSEGSRGTSAYTVTGEFVYAVQYRNIRFSTFSTRSVDTAYLEKGNHWKSYLVDRADDDDDDDEGGEGTNGGVSTEVTGPVEVGDLEGGAFESVNVDGEQIIYEVDEDDEE